MTVLFTAQSLVLLELKKKPRRRGGTVTAGTAPSALPRTSGPGSSGAGATRHGPFCCLGQVYPYSASEHPTERQAEERRVQTIPEAQCSPISFKISATCPN